MYHEIFTYVKEYLVKNNGDLTKIQYTSFRKRSDHIKRVFMWANRIIEEDLCINKDALLIAALFHDVGYGIDHDNTNHALNSAIICEEYLTNNNFDPEFTKFVVYLVKNHSNKKLLTEKNTPIELILLMEADLLDETGALSIVWDCMMEGKQEDATFEKSYQHIFKFSKQILNNNPMVTKKAKKYWIQKQTLVKDFIASLSFDLGL